MDTQAIINEIDGEISRLEKAKAILSNLPNATEKRGPGRPKSDKSVPVRKTRTLSEEARAKIVAAQKKRWANAAKQK